MRYDLRVLWIEDTASYYNESKEILEMFAEDERIKLKFKYFQDATQFIQQVKMDSDGFKLYDLIFIDYTLSNGIVGSTVIESLRDVQLDSDILFYSSEHEADIREIIKDNIGSYEGVYIASRDSFNDKACYLIKKNSRRLTSLASIRGFLMDQTSENDFTMKSYILQKYDSLTPNQQHTISMMLKESIDCKREKIAAAAKEQINSLDKNGIRNINKAMNIMSALFPLEERYQVLQSMVTYLNDDVFEEITIDTYINDIIKARNTLAHKKVDVCRRQKYVLYADTMKQFKTRACPDECTKHSDDYKYSMEQWLDIRYKVLKFGDEIDKLQSKLDD